MWMWVLFHKVTNLLAVLAKSAYSGAKNALREIGHAGLTRVVPQWVILRRYLAQSLGSEGYRAIAARSSTCLAFRVSQPSIRIHFRTMNPSGWPLTTRRGRGL